MCKLNGSMTVERALLTAGASMVGFADLRSVEDRPFPELTRAISLALVLERKVISRITDGPTIEYCREYERVNQALDDLADYTVELVRSRGYRARTMSATDRKYVTGAFLTSIFSHKKAATLSGLGWIGKNDLLVTKQFGSALRLNTVFTDMPLATGEPIQRSFCGRCQACAKECPVNAPIGVLWNPDVSREELLDIRKCYSQAKKLSGEIGVEPIICGICIVACPWTKRYIGNSER